MFTGIIQTIGAIELVSEQTQGKKFRIKTHFQDVLLGESIAVNGVCLTVSELVQNKNYQSLDFFISSETLEKTNLGALVPFTPVNLERALQLQTRLSGHLVQGHIDAVGTLNDIKPMGACYEVLLGLPEHLIKYTVVKGSIAVNGISLTINRIEDNTLSIMIIPHTWMHTNLHLCKIGQHLNIEVDIIAKYLENMSHAYRS